MLKINSYYAIAILAAGKGKRMKNPNLPKVLFPLNGKPMLGWVLETASKLNPNFIFVIVGFKKELVIEYISKNFFQQNIQIVEQKEQIGTANAILQLEGYIPSEVKHLLVLSGDVPNVRDFTLRNFVQKHLANDYDLSLIITEVDDPTGYGRIIRQSDGKILQIIEQKDLKNDFETIKEINTGIYCIKTEGLFDSLKLIKNANAQGEYYLTDLVGIYINNNRKVFAFKSKRSDEFLGINTPEELIRLEKQINDIE
ncbi:MAG: sugar phosphate nucleotidyltransferase [Candidatus Kapaibacteriales bacterium]